ncbi:MAG: hypothetical protein ACJ8FY_16650 [Gemmataceae bacterium]
MPSKRSVRDIHGGANMRLAAAFHLCGRGVAGIKEDSVNLDGIKQSIARAQSAGS